MMKMFIHTSHCSSFFFLLLLMLLKSLNKFFFSNLYALPMPAYCQFRYVTCNNNEKLLCASCSVFFICFRRSLQLPQGSSVVSSNKSNLTLPSHSFFILIAILHSPENSLMARLSSLVHVFYGNELAYQREHIS